MPKKVAELGALEVSRLKAIGLHSVGAVDGLKLCIKSKGARSWVLRATVGGKVRDMGLGSYPTVTLAQARDLARAARISIREGVDPVDARQDKRNALAAAQAKARTFDQCLDALLDAKSDEWKNSKHRAQWRSTLETYASPVFGSVAVQKVDLPMVLSVLEPIWKTKTTTATRLRGRIEAVLDWAKARGFRDGENPARWRGHLDQLLAKPRKISKVRHQPALIVHEMPIFMQALRQVEGMSARALEFAVLTATRSGEVRGAVWKEFDLNTCTWTIPAERMKAGVEHKVPLPSQAIKLLRDLPRIEGTDLVFPGRNARALSDMSMTACMRRLGFKDKHGDVCVPHGCRSTFRDWAAKHTHVANEVVEMALAHTIESAVEAAYRRGDLFEKRTGLMQGWANFCIRPTKRNHVAASYWFDPRDKVVNGVLVKHGEGD